MSEKPVKDYDKFMLRLPEGMRDALAEQAKANGRSMNSEIVQIIGESVYGVSDFPDDFQLMYEYVTTEKPSDEEAFRIRDQYITHLIQELSKRINHDSTEILELLKIRNADGRYR